MRNTKRNATIAIRWFFVAVLLFLVSCGGSKNSSNQELAIESVEDDTEPATEVIIIDIESSVVSGQFLIGGLPFNAPSGNNQVNLQNASIKLFSPQGGGENIFVTDIYNPDFELSLLKDTYLPVYNYETALVVPFNPEIELQAVISQSTSNTQPEKPKFIIHNDPDNSTLPVNYEKQLPAHVLSIENDVNQDLNIEIIEITPELQLNNQPFPTDENEIALILLKSPESEALISLGTTNLPPEPITIIPGQYSVIYQYISGSQIPKNTYKTVLRNIEITDSGILAVEITSATVRSFFTLNGNPAPQSGLEFGRLSLKDTESEDSIRLGNSNEQSTSVSVIYGEYNAHYEFREHSGLMPFNSDAIIERNIQIDEDTEQLNLDIESILISGGFYVNGELAPSSAFDKGDIYLVDEETGAKVYLGQTNDLYYDPKIITPGTYSLEFEWREGPGVMPANPKEIFSAGNQLMDSQIFNVDLPVVSISTAFTLNGEPFPQSGLNFGNIWAARHGTENLISVGRSYDTELSINLIPGEYDFYFEFRENNAGMIPFNHNFKFINSLDITESIALFHDFSTKKIRIEPTLNGQPFPASPDFSAEIHIGTNSADKMFAYQSNLEPFDLTVLTGNYRVYYSVVEASDNLTIPVNKNEIVTEITIE